MVVPRHDDRPHGSPGGQWRWEMARAPFGDFAPWKPRRDSATRAQPTACSSRSISIFTRRGRRTGRSPELRPAARSGDGAGRWRRPAAHLLAATFTQRPDLPADCRGRARSAGRSSLRFRSCPAAGVAVALRPRGRAGRGRQRRRPAEQHRRIAIRPGRRGAAVRSEPEALACRDVRVVPARAGIHLRLAVLDRSVEGRLPRPTS